MPMGTILKGEVRSIEEGDALVFETANKRQFKVRLAEIDAPEKGQPYFETARQALASQVSNQTIAVTLTEWDKFGRIIGEVRLGDEYINAWLVAEGHAWVSRDFSDDPLLPILEEQARAENKGLWALPETDRIAPWDWALIPQE
jgi:endonuclease YncB( thermonuclease family)